MRASCWLLLSLVLLAAGCDAPVRIGVRQARAAGVDVPSAGGGPQFGFTPASMRSIATGGLIVSPQLPQPHEPDDVVGFKLQHDGAGAVRPVTFGQIFIPGQLLRGSGLAARIGGREVPVQLDVKTTNPDGSIRFGIITLTAAAPADAMLVRRPAEAAAPVDLAAMLDKYTLTVDLVMHGADGTKPYHFAAAALLADALRTGKASYWLRGPQATEARVDVPVASSLHLTFDIRGYADGSTFTDVQFNNDIAMQPVGGDVQYDVTISQNGKPVFQQAAITQYQYQTWHREIWSNGDPGVNVVHDVAAMERAGAVLGYDLTAGVSEVTLAQDQSKLGEQGYADILGHAGINKYMPMTGGRSDIGPLPGWDVDWLVTQNAEAARFALVQEDVAGSIPWHMFDPTTRTYLTLDKYPTLWDDGRGGNSAGTTGLTQMGNVKCGWYLDFSHQPGLSYLPYIMTGLRYYLDQLDAQATWTELTIWPFPRQNGQGIVASSGVQIRGGAWSLRELVEAAYINPDDAPLKPYFRRLVANNLDYLLTEAKSAHEGEAYGWFKVGDPYGREAPWQQDFLASTITLAAEQGVPGAKELLTWEANYLAGRFLAGDKGLSPYDGISYQMQFWKPPSDTPFQTWHEIGAAIVANNWSGGGDRYHAGNIAYYYSARDVLSGIVTVTGLPEAKQALAWLHDHPPPGASGADVGGSIAPLTR